MSDLQRAVQPIFSINIEQSWIAIRGLSLKTLLFFSWNKFIIRKKITQGIQVTTLISLSKKVQMVKAIC